MSKVLPLERWKKQPMPEREAFSDEESDEEDSEYEEVVIPKAKKRKLKGEKSNAKRIKLNPNPRTPKKQEPRAIPIKKASSERPRASKAVPGPPPGKPPKRFKPNQSKPSSIPSRR